MNHSISTRSVARRTVATYAGQASVLLPAAAITVVVERHLLALLHSRAMAHKL